MQRVTDGETEEGIFSLDLSAGLEGTGKVMKTPHTVAFQDRTEATQFLYMMRSQSDPDLASVELVPMIPKVRNLASCGWKWRCRCYLFAK